MTPLSDPEIDALLEGSGVPMNERADAREFLRLDEDGRWLYTWRELGALRRAQGSRGAAINGAYTTLAIAAGVLAWLFGLRPPL